MIINFSKSSMFNKKYKELFDRYKTLKKIFKKKKIVVFDVGANEGQTIIEIYRSFPKSIVHSFEPLQECRKSLIFLKNKLKTLTIHLNFVGVGDKLCKKIFYKNNSTDLSSFIKINKNSKLMIKMKKLKKNKKYLKGINIPIKINQITLDSYIKKNKIKNIDILKIDTQSYDDQVLKGLNKSYLKKIKSIIVEINLWDYYNRSQSFLNFEKILGKHFKLWDISAIYKNPKYKNTDHLDAIYLNKSYIKKIIN